MTHVQATFRPNDDQDPWAGTLRQTVVTRILDANGEQIEGSKSVVWDMPSPGVAHYISAAGVLEIDGKAPCEAYWANGQFNHSGGFTG